MSVENESGLKAFTAGEALAAYRLVRQSAAGTVMYCDAGQIPVGSTVAAAAIGKSVTVKLMGHPGSRKLTALTSFAAGARLYTAADGMVDDVVTGAPLFIACAAATALNDIIECMSMAGLETPRTDKRTQTAKADTVTLTAAELLSKIIDGTPTAAAVYTLPTAALLVAAIPDCKVGDSFEFAINNKAAGADAITVAAGAGGTADGTLTVAQDVTRSFLGLITNVGAGTEAYFVYGLGA